MNKRALMMDKQDNVVTVLDHVKAGELVDIILNGKVIDTITSKNEIDHYHKLAVRSISLHQEVFKYGEIIGKCTKPIVTGEHVHVNNIESVMTK